MLKILPISNFMKILTVGAELFHADVKTGGLTDMTHLIVAFHNFANAPNNNNKKNKNNNNNISNIPGNHKVKELQKTAILGTAHILRKVLT